jgi:rhomboid protease GluP
MFLIMGPSAFTPTAQQLVDFGANFGPKTRLEWQAWRIITSCFVHAGILHLLMNMYVLFSLGRLAELFFGLRRFLMLYLCAGIGGALASMWWNPAVAGIGASGAILGIFGGMIALLEVNKGHINPEAASNLSKKLIQNVLLCVVAGFMIPNVDNACHAGGFAVGWLMGFALAPKKGQPALALREIASIAVFSIVTLAAYFGAGDRVKNSDVVVGDRKVNAYNQYMNDVLPLLQRQDTIAEETSKNPTPEKLEAHKQLLKDMQNVKTDDQDIAELHQILLSRTQLMIDYFNAANQKDANPLVLRDMAKGVQDRLHEFAARRDSFAKRYGLVFEKQK